MLTVCLALSSAFTPAPPLSASALASSRASPTMSAAGMGRRAALLGLAAIPLQQAKADAIADIAARNAIAAEAEKSPERLAEIAKKEEDDSNGALIAAVGISALIVGSSAISLAPVSENVKRVGKKVRTGQGRKY